MDFVINEWLLDYLRPETAPENKKLAVDFLNSFMSKTDKWYVRRPSGFLQKLFDYRKLYNNDPSKDIFKMLEKLVMLDSEKIILVDNNESEEFSEKIKNLLFEKGTNFQSDAYLFEAAQQTKSKIIVTTDEKLMQRFEKNKEFKLILASDFVEQYIAQ